MWGKMIEQETFREISQSYGKRCITGVFRIRNTVNRDLYLLYPDKKYYIIYCLNLIMLCICSSIL